MNISSEFKFVCDKFLYNLLYKFVHFFFQVQKLIYFGRIILLNDRNINFILFVHL